METTLITIFQSIKDTSTPFHRPVEVILQRIQEGKSKELVKEIRKEKDKEKRNLLKQKLPAICFSGEFIKRNDDAIKVHSGLICLDFDGFKLKRELMAKKDELAKNKHTYSVFISPSGNGLKALVKIPPEIDSHKNYFLALQKLYDCENFDRTCKNISRVCYESYDPLIYINENSITWTKKEEEAYTQHDVRNSMPTIKIDDENEIVRRLMMWWEGKYGFVDGERNNNLFILSSALNEFGVTQSLSKYILNQFECKDFTSKEIEAVVNSAYANSAAYNTKFFENSDIVDKIKTDLNRGVPKKEVRSRLKDTGVEGEVVDSVINRVEETTNERTFWVKSQRGAVSIVHWKFKKFLEDNGFYKFAPDGSKNHIFVKVTNNLIDNTSEEEIKDFALTYLQHQDDLSIYNHFADKTRYFKEDFLSMLSCVDVYFVEDTKDSAYLYYKNCAVQVTKDAIKMIDYIDLGGYCWVNQVIDREFEICKSDACDYKTFIANISGDDALRIKSVESTIGFLLHGYKSLGYSPACIINDEVISDHPEGGTGKGLFVNGVSQLKKMVIIDGKSFFFEKSFAYQLVSADTQVLCFDDVRKSFDFERLFSIVSEGITLEKKNKDAIKIPFRKSPKIVITTNYAIKGKGNSFERRKWELEFKQYYSKNFTPLTEFGRLLFSEWDEDEWCAFDNYMVKNLQGFLKAGFVKSDFKNLRTRKFIAETDHSFWEWVTEDNQVIKFDEPVLKYDLYNGFTNEYPDFAPRAKMSITLNKFYKWLRSYAMYSTRQDATEGRNVDGRFIVFNTNGIMEPEEQEKLPF
tara:strand:- start:3395 stop:5806 length:2412 start_codon:yes stop_codon:yes gene_type:complete